MHEQELVCRLWLYSSSIELKSEDRPPHYEHYYVSPVICKIYHVASFYHFVRSCARYWKKYATITSFFKCKSFWYLLHLGNLICNTFCVCKTRLFFHIGPKLTFVKPTNAIIKVYRLWLLQLVDQSECVAVMNLSPVVLQFRPHPTPKFPPTINPALFPQN